MTADLFLFARALACDPGPMKHVKNTAAVLALGLFAVFLMSLCTPEQPPPDPTKPPTLYDRIFGR